MFSKCLLSGVYNIVWSITSVKIEINKKSFLRTIVWYFLEKTKRKQTLLVYSCMADRTIDQFTVQTIFRTETLVHNNEYYLASQISTNNPSRLYRMTGVPAQTGQDGWTVT